jgi:hypothetical protein
MYFCYDYFVKEIDLHQFNCCMLHSSFQCFDTRFTKYDAVRAWEQVKVILKEEWKAIQWLWILFNKKNLISLE